MSERKQLPPISVRALRTKESGTYERLLASLLISANNSWDPLKKIQKMCEAVFVAKQMLPENPGNLDVDSAQSLHAVSTALDSVEPDKYVTSWWQGKPYQWVERYSIPWGFAKTKENFDTHIKSWFKELPKCWTQYVTPLDSFRVYKTRVSCSGCGEVFLDLPRTDGKKCRELVKEKFEIKVKKLPGISKETHKQWKRQEEEDEEDGWWDEDYPYFEMPYIQVGFFECPKCNKPVVLGMRNLEGDYHPCDPEIVNDLKRRLEAKATYLKVEDYDFLKDEWLHSLFYEVSEWLTREGILQVRNQFINQVMPKVCEWYSELCKLVDQTVFDEVFKAMFREKKPEKEE